MSRRRLLLAALVVMACAMWGVQTSGASFTSGSSTSASVTSGDWVAPSVTVSDPGASVSGSVTVGATATDNPGTGVAQVRIQYAPAGTGTWSHICTSTSTPYACSWDTTQVADGSYDLRATATDKAGLTGTSATVTTKVANQSGLVFDPITSPVRGPLNLSARLVNASGGPGWFYFEYRPAGTSSWSSIPGCGTEFYWSLSQRTCNWSAPVEGSYDIQAVASYLFGQVLTEVQYGVRIDNLAPTGTLTVPGSPLQDVATLTATASDATSQGTGVASVDFQYRRSGGAWTSCGVSTRAPYSCSLDTTALAGGTYEFRIEVTDGVGNTFSSPAQSRTVDNTPASTSITSPAAGSLHSGTVAVTATATSSRGISSVRIDASLDGANWYPVCTRYSAPYSCQADTSSISGSQQVRLRSVATQGNGTWITSDIVTVTVDNRPLRGADIQAIGMPPVGKIGEGDRLEYTYEGPLDLGSIRSGWNGSEISARATLTENGSNDRFSVDGVNLGSVDLRANYTSATATFDVTLSASTATVNGVVTTVVTMRIDTVRTNGNRLNNVSGRPTMVWTPSANAKTMSKVACSTSPVTESGDPDADL